MNFLRKLIDRARGTDRPNEGQGFAWHTYEHPQTGDRIRIYNATDDDMPEVMAVKGRQFSHVPPFGGVPEYPVFVAGDLIYQRLTKEQRTALVKIRTDELIKEARNNGLVPMPRHTIEHRHHIAYAKENVVVEMQKSTEG